MREQEILRLLITINRKLDKMALNFDKLISDVAEEGTVIASAVTLLGTLSAALKQALADLAAALAANDPAAQAAAQAQLDAIVASVETNKETLAHAVLDNTPSA